MRKVAYRLYLVFLVSWFLHIGTRIEALGALRLDLLLLAMIAALIGFSKDEALEGAAPVTAASNKSDSRIRKLIVVMLAFSVLTLPLVEWPGSVLNTGLPDYVKALVFYFFTAKLVTTPKRLRGFLLVFVAAMTFRVLEPLYLHVTTGYWGSFATTSDGALDRLSGAPHDIINPNGLAFVILTVIPFFHFLGPMTFFGGVAYLATLPLLVWALLLTGSRSGLLGFLIVLAAIWLKSRRKVIFTGLLVVGAVVISSTLSADLTDRYRSIFDSNTKNAATSEGRVSGLKEDFNVAMRRPFFGHGLGTSLEANANFAGNDAPSHNLYLETAQELGFIGVVILVALLVSIVMDLRASLAALRGMNGASMLMVRLTAAVQVWLAMNILFSFASYGLRSYEWYLAAGFSDVIRRYAASLQQRPQPVPAPEAIERHRFRAVPSRLRSA